MTIETSLKVEFGGDSYTIMAKMIRIDNTSYFFIRDKENEKPLLSGKILELTFVNSFSLTEFGGIVKSEDIPKNIVSAIQDAIMKKRQVWFMESDMK